MASLNGMTVAKNVKTKKLSYLFSGQKWAKIGFKKLVKRKGFYFFKMLGPFQKFIANSSLLST